MLAVFVALVRELLALCGVAWVVFAAVTFASRREWRHWRIYRAQQHELGDLQRRINALKQMRMEVRGLSANEAARATKELTLCLNDQLAEDRHARGGKATGRATRRQEADQAGKEDTGVQQRRHHLGIHSSAKKSAKSRSTEDSDR
jgi:hypothetical protein